MRIDHIAYRVADREKAAQFFVEALGYRIADEFEINFDDNTCAQCYALSPTERFNNIEDFSGWNLSNDDGNYHMPPEIFVSEGSEGSIVAKWVESKGGTGAVHHIAYQVDDVAVTMSEWKKKGLAEFTTEEPISADGLVQCFTKQHPLTGIIYEFIFRTKKGFNVDNVKDLMASTVKD
jgi:catechol 2,3-dioxygenase-like lactoylglutathione lyase family enzyme